MELIALRTVRYNDKHSILSAFSNERGPISLLVPASQGREARRRRALLMPMAVVEAEVAFRPGRDIGRIADLQPLMPAVATATDPRRAMTALFLADFFGSILRDSAPDAATFAFLKRTACLLETAPDDALPSFHIHTLIEALEHAGIFPDLATWQKGSVFDMRDGCWRLSPPLHADFIGTEGARLAHTLAAMHEGGHRINIMRQRSLRNEVLDMLIRYYTLHLSSLNLPSLEVLRAF